MKIFAAAVIAACALTTTTVTAAGADGAPWGYRTNDTSMAAPDQWAEHYPTCGGQRQSPIDIETTAGCISEKRSLTFSGSCADFNVSQSEESFTASVNGGSCAVTANGASYDMLQFHMHVPSEHTLNGEYLGGEIHFVHSNADSSALLVTGVFFKAVEGASDPWVVSVLDALDQVSPNATASASLASYADLVNKAADAQGVFNYAGSLTTPACSEIVDWWVVKKPVDVSTADLGRLQSQLRELHLTDDGTCMWNCSMSYDAPLAVTAHEPPFTLAVNDSSDCDTLKSAHEPLKVSERFSEMQPAVVSMSMGDWR